MSVEIHEIDDAAGVSTTMQENLEQLSQLLQKLGEPLQHDPGMRDETRYPVCVKLRVTPCNAAYVPVGPQEVAFAQNLSGGGAALIFASDPVSDYPMIQLRNHTIVLRLLWKRAEGKFVEAGGTFVARF
jgi:hypothetical protein